MKITINSNEYEIPDGCSVAVINNKVIINGVELTKFTGIDINKIVIYGDVNNVTTSKASVEVRQNVRGNVEAGGSVNCCDVGGNVSARGSVNCGDVRQGVTVGGSVNCGDVYGGINR